MSEVSTGTLDRVEEHLKSTPPKAEEALSELKPFLEHSKADPRANLYQAVALSLLGKVDEASIYATLAEGIAEDIRSEAAALLAKLPKPQVAK